MSRKRFSLVVLAVVALLLVGCTELASIEITTDASTLLEVGQVIELTAIGKSSAGMSAELGDVAWSVSDDSVATIIAADQTATLTVVGEGDVIVTAVSSEFSGSAGFTSVSNIPNPVIFSESFEDMTLGANPDGWTVVDQDVHATNGYSGGKVSAERASDGKNSIKLVSVPDAEGRVEYMFDEALTYHSLSVDLYKVDANKENVNIELHNDDGRVFGLFISASGNLRHRKPDGKNESSPNDAGNDQWYTIEFKWNDDTKLYNAYLIRDGQRTELTPAGGSAYEDANNIGGVNKVSIAITKRDGDKIAYIDNVKVVDLAVQDMLDN